MKFDKIFSPNLEKVVLCRSDLCIDFVLVGFGRLVGVALGACGAWGTAWPEA